jgi:hypothetical protein
MVKSSMFATVFGLKQLAILTLGGHPKPAIEGHLKTGHSDTSKVDLDAGQKTPGVVAALTPDASCNRASPKVTGHIREIVREQMTSLETTEAGKNHQVFGQSRWPVLE